MRRPSAVPLLLLLAAALGGCAFLDDQMHIASASTCISKNCRGEPDAPGYQKCEAACRSTYGK